MWIIHNNNFVKYNTTVVKRKYFARETNCISKISKLKKYFWEWLIQKLKENEIKKNIKIYKISDNKLNKKYKKIKKLNISNKLKHNLLKSFLCGIFL